MRKLCLLIGLILLLGCGSQAIEEPASDMAEEVIEEIEGSAETNGDMSESRGQEQAALPTPLPPLDKSESAEASFVVTPTDTITDIQPVTTTVREAAASAVVPATLPNNFRCAYDGADGE